MVEAGPNDRHPLVIHNDVDEEAEYSPPGRGLRIALLALAIAAVFAGMIGAVLMVARGGAR